MNKLCLEEKKTLRFDLPKKHLAQSYDCAKWHNHD